MARTKSHETNVNALSLDQQMRYQGIIALVDQRVKAEVASTNASEQLAADFTRWMANENPEVYTQLLRSFALEVASA